MLNIVHSGKNWLQNGENLISLSRNNSKSDQGMYTYQIDTLNTFLKLITIFNYFIKKINFKNSSVHFKANGQYKIQKSEWVDH